MPGVPCQVSTQWPERSGKRRAALQRPAQAGQVVLHTSEGTNPVRVPVSTTQTSFPAGS
jgi:hypothetical protein